MSRKDWALLLMLSLLWGASFLFIRVAVQDIPPFTLVFGRVGIAALALGLLLAATGEGAPRGRSVWIALATMGVLNNIIPFSLIFWGQKEIGAGLASILNATTPLFTVLVAHVFTTDEKLTPAKILGVALGIAGVAAMIGPSALAGLDRSIAAQLACLGAALSYGFAGIYGRRFKPMGVKPMYTAFGTLTASASIMLVIAAIVDQPWRLPAPSMTAIGALLGLALLSTALAYLIFYRILASAGATNLSLVTFLIPPSAILLGVIILGERIEPRHIVGMIFIGAGLACIDGKLARLFRREASGRASA
ncbi:DMT family transporter [Terrarubrum flagellatum]|uniref:DMT family transporter n=1 Tax=Terrirubrum flagellatum TaxID=2895980 RepID=UPI0031452C5A